MARSRDDNNRLPSSGPHLRFVRFEETDDDPDQPVKVKNLKWDDESEFEPYGEAFRIGDATTTASGDFHVAWSSSARRWLPIGGATGGGNTVIEVECVDLDEGPNPDDFFSPRYQPVRVRKLALTGYQAPESEDDDDANPIPTDNATIVISTTKGGWKHGGRGNGIVIEFEVDGAIGPNALATFDDDDDPDPPYYTGRLLVKVKATTVLWSEVATAVAIPMMGAFTLTASVPSAEVGGIDGLLAVLKNGADGSLEMTGPEFGVGDTNTKNVMRIGRRFSAVKRDGLWQMVNEVPEIRKIIGQGSLTPPVPDIGDAEDELFQRTVVKELQLTDYEPSTSGQIDGGNTIICFSTHRGSPLHGERGDGITVSFEIDGSLIVPATSTYDATDMTLAILVDSDEVLWSDVIEAVRKTVNSDTGSAIKYAGAFSLVALDPTAEVGADIESITAELSGGADGTEQPVGSNFRIGNAATHLADGQVRYIIWNASTQIWEIFNSGESGTLLFGVIYTRLEGATSLTAWGEGEVTPIDDLGEEGDVIDIFTRMPSSVEVGRPVWYFLFNGFAMLVRPDCIGFPDV